MPLDVAQQRHYRGRFLELCAMLGTANGCLLLQSCATVCAGSLGSRSARPATAVRDLSYTAGVSALLQGVVYSSTTRLCMV